MEELAFPVLVAWQAIMHPVKSSSQRTYRAMEP